MVPLAMVPMRSRRCQANGPDWERALLPNLQGLWQRERAEVQHSS